MGEGVGQEAARVAQRPINAAGGVVWRRRPDGEREIVVIHRPRYDDWSLPKGKAEPGESDAETALREVTEETGLECRLGPSLGSVRYKDRNGREKVVHYWAMEPIADRGFQPGDEVDERRWLPVGEARRLISYDRDREILDTFGSA
jgi:8-oxo-dGTP pyrophosphatase MutT (NUDIX family)